MNRNHRPGARADERFDLVLVDVERVRANVGKANAGSAQDKRVGRGDKGEGRYDDFVIRPDFEEKRGQLQRVGAGCGQKNLGRPQHFLKQRLAFSRVALVASDLADGN